MQIEVFGVDLSRRKGEAAAADPTQPALYRCYPRQVAHYLTRPKEGRGNRHRERLGPTAQVETEGMDESSLRGRGPSSSRGAISGSRPVSVEQ